MDITIPFEDYEPWGDNATNAWDRIRAERKVCDLEALLEDVHGRSICMSDLNDILAYETDLVYKSLGMTPDDRDEHTVEEVGRKWCEDEGCAFVSARWTAEEDGCETIEVTYREDGEDADTRTLDPQDVQALYDADGVEMLWDNEVVYTWVYDC